MRQIVAIRQQNEPQGAQALAQGPPDSLGTCNPSRQGTSCGTYARLDQSQDIVADGVKKTGQDAPTIFSLVGQMGQVGLQNHRATTRQRGRIVNLFAQDACFFDRQGKALDQLL
jgi:hypothetical protein